MNAQRLFVTTALTTLALSLGQAAHAQTTISDAQTSPVQTSTGGDITIATGGSLDITGSTGPAIVLDSDNAVVIDGSVAIDDTDNAVGVEIIGGNTGSFTLEGGISVSEDFTNEDTDGDRVPDGDFASGSGRTGILISGASPFVGNVQMGETAGIIVEGNDSFAIRLAETAGITGNLLTDGAIEIVGTNSIGVGVEGQIIGNLANGANINARGTNVQAVNISGDIDGQFSSSGRITNTGYRFTTRSNLAGRTLLQDDDRLQGGAAVQISGNVANGILMDEVSTTTTADDGTETTTITARSSITQFGSAAAVLIDGQGTPISIGRVSAITDPTADGYDETLLFGFVNEGDISGNGVYDDVNARALEIRDAMIEGGLFNSGNLTVTTFRSGDDGTADLDGFTGTAQVIVLGNGAIAEAINNTGAIIAQASEATDEVFADRDNPVAARLITAIAIDIEDGATVDSLVNTGIITASVTGRRGNMIALRDASGTLRNISNTGRIVALGVNSDANGVATVDFQTTAMDLSANTTGVTITQDLAEDLTPDDGIDPVSPAIIGDIYLGSGDDVITVNAGSIVGDIDFGAGNGVLTLDGGSTYRGGLRNADGDLTLTVANGSTLTNTNTEVLTVASASFDGTSVFQPTLDGATGNAGTLNASGTISFAEGASIAPVLTNIIGTSNTVFRVADAANLVIGGDIASLSGIESPFLYNTTYSIDPNDPNALLITLDLRETSELGLDSAQAATFTSAFEALGSNTGLGNAFVNISDEAEFNRAFNQLLPEFSAAARQFVIANVDGATGAVGAHLDNVRRSQDRPGGVWIQEFAYFADRDLAGLSEQYRGSGFGFTAGADTAWGPFHAVGINAGFASTEIESVADIDSPLDVLTIQLGTYAGYQQGDFGVEAYAGFGYNDFESERNILVGDFIGSSDGDWSGTHYNGSLRAGYDVKFSEKFWARPTVSVDYINLKEKAYTETGDLGVALDIDGRTSDSGSATAMLNFGAHFMGKRTWVRPGLRVGYRNEFIGDGVFTTGRFAGLTTPFEIQSEEFPDSGFLLGLTVAAGSEYSSFSFDFDSDIRDGFIRHTGRIVLRLLF